MPPLKRHKGQGTRHKEGTRHKAQAPRKGRKAPRKRAKGNDNTFCLVFDSCVLILESFLCLVSCALCLYCFIFSSSFWSLNISSLNLAASIKSRSLAAFSISFLVLPMALSIW